MTIQGRRGGFAFGDCELTCPNCPNQKYVRPKNHTQILKIKLNVQVEYLVCQKLGVLKCSAHNMPLVKINQCLKRLSENIEVRSFLSMLVISR